MKYIKVKWHAQLKYLGLRLILISSRCTQYIQLYQYTLQRVQSALPLERLTSGFSPPRSVRFNVGAVNVDFVVNKVAVGEVLFRSHQVFVVRITLLPVPHIPWTLDPQKCSFTKLRGQNNACKYVCIYGVTDVRFVDHYVRRYMDNVYIPGC